MPQDVGTPPFHRLKPVDDAVWTVDAEPIRVAGLLPLPLRMTVVRLAEGGLLLYSPTRHTPDLQRDLEALGPIRHLVAPNIAHWMFVRDWQRACPGTKTWGVPGLRQRAQVRAAGLRIDTDLGPVAPADWRDEIDQVLVRSGFFIEVDLFHRASRTLMVTDLVLNVDGAKMPPLPRSFAGLVGILAPTGRAPIYLRLLLTWNRRAAAAAAARLVGFAPRRVIMSHGDPFETDATARLRASLGGLLETETAVEARSPLGGRTGAVIGAGLLIGVGLAVARRRGRQSRR